MQINNKRVIGFVGGLSVAIAIWFIPLKGLDPIGRHCLSLTLCAVIMWAMEVANAGFIGCGLIVGYMLLLDPQIITPSLVFKLWSMPMQYLIIGGFLIAAAVKNSGVANRFALLFLGRFVKTYKQAIIACYLLSYALSLIIPQSFPRAFLIMSAMSCVINKSGMDKKVAANIGFAVFASQIGSIMFLMTSESMLNFALLEQIPVEFRPSWGEWAYGLGIPSLLLGVMMCFVQLKLFPSPKTFNFSKETAQEELKALGALSSQEIKTIFWLAVAVALWMTDRLHGVDLGWVTIGVAVLMSMPLIGDVITKDDWAEINIGTLMFLTACIAIANVGGVTGMNTYLANFILPSELDVGPVVFALVAAGVTMLMHLAVGSIMATIALVTPALIIMAEPAGLSPMVVAFIVYIIAATQYIFPYQNLNVTIGLGDRAGGYTTGDIIRFGIACTIPVLICVVFCIAWWKIIGWI
ncbi:MAG: anion permease [Eubacteriales bacterium]|nr:anion permease [Eubacteriales bacterium]